jgi:hypothetical protein
LELNTINGTSTSRHPWQNAILIAALCMAVPARAKTRDRRIQQATPQIANLGTKAECGSSDFSFDTLRAQPAGYGFTRITGRITNHCAEAMGAEIKITTYNRAGDILSDDTIWPAGITNIPANSEFPFEWLDTKEVFAKFTVTIISVKSWPETLVRGVLLGLEPANALTPSN